MGEAADIVDELIERQGEMYAGGSIDAVLELLAEGIRWHVPGSSPIAGDYEGRPEVRAYLERRREIATGSMTMRPRTGLEHGDTVVKLTGGSASIGGKEMSWETVGVYRVSDGRVVEVWLVPLDSAAFDRIWSS